MRQTRVGVLGQATSPLCSPLLGTAKELMITEVYRRLAEQGFAEIRPCHGYVFRCIDASGSRLTELAERAWFTKQAVGEVVSNLERLGYVERVSDPADGRARIIHLTHRGQWAHPDSRATCTSITGPSPDGNGVMSDTISVCQ